MNTVVRSALSRKADWPYHSTCMLFLRSGCAQDARRGGRVVVLVAAAAHERRERRYQAGHDREGECLVQPRAKRGRYELWEEGVSGDRRSVGRAERGQGVR